MSMKFEVKAYQLRHGDWLGKASFGDKGITASAGTLPEVLRDVADTLDGWRPEEVFGHE